MLAWHLPSVVYSSGMIFSTTVKERESTFAYRQELKRLLLERADEAGEGKNPL